MKPIVNHRSGDLGEIYTKRTWEGGGLPVLSEPLRVPILSTSNHEDPLLPKMLGEDPLFYMDRRPEKHWDWWLKVESVESYAKMFKQEGHRYFLYLDSDDGFLWRSFTAAECRELLGDKDVMFQKGPKGLCAGCFVARTENFQSLVDVLRVFKDTKADKVSLASTRWAFDDQEAWRALASIMPDRIGVQKDEAIMTRELPRVGMLKKEEKPESEGLGDTIKKVTDRLGIRQCGGCKGRQKKLNRLFPYKKEDTKA